MGRAKTWRKHPNCLSKVGLRVDTGARWSKIWCVYERRLRNGRKMVYWDKCNLRLSLLGKEIVVTVETILATRFDLLGCEYARWFWSAERQGHSCCEGKILRNLEITYFSPYCVLEVRLVDRVIENGASCKGNYTSMRCTTNGRAVLRTRLPLETLV